MRSFLILLLFIAILQSCAPTRFVKPLEKGQHAIGASLGGPLIKYGSATIPVPMVVADYGYGFDSTLTGFAGLNVTSLLFGNFQVEAGLTKQVLKQNKYYPGVSVSPVFNILYRNTEAKKFYPQIDANAYWEYGAHKNIFYIGMSNWFELASKRTLDESQPNHWMFIPQLGHTFNGKKWALNLEAKVIAPNLSNKDIVVEYQTPLKDKGAFGIYVGITRKF